MGDVNAAPIAERDGIFNGLGVDAVI